MKQVGRRSAFLVASAQFGSDDVARATPKYQEFRDGRGDAESICLTHPGSSPWKESATVGVPSVSAKAAKARMIKIAAVFNGLI